MSDDIKVLKKICTDIESFIGEKCYISNQELYGEITGVNTPYGGGYYMDKFPVIVTVTSSKNKDASIVAAGTICSCDTDNVDVLLANGTYMSLSKLLLIMSLNTVGVARQQYPWSSWKTTHITREVIPKFKSEKDINLIKRITNTSINHQFTKHELLLINWCGDLADMSYCERAKMGTFIMIDNRTFVSGINGTLPGTKNECDEISLVCNVCNVAVNPELYVEGEQHCKEGTIVKRPKTTHRAIHSETNAIFNASRNGLSVDGKTMITSVSPCSNCANNIISNGIAKVIFLDYHDDLIGLHTLVEQGVSVYHYLVPNFSRKVPTKA